jgi:hypothetical protein
MAASDFDLAPDLDALVVEVCRAHGLPPREEDAIRSLVASPPATWPICCRGSCRPCIDDQKHVAHEVLRRWQEF